MTEPVNWASKLNGLLRIEYIVWWCIEQWTRQTSIQLYFLFWCTILQCIRLSSKSNLILFDDLQRRLKWISYDLTINFRSDTFQNYTKYRIWHSKTHIRCRDRHAKQKSRTTKCENKSDVEWKWGNGDGYETFIVYNNKGFLWSRSILFFSVAFHIASL